MRNRYFDFFPQSAGTAQQPAFNKPVMSSRSALPTPCHVFASVLPAAVMSSRAPSPHPVILSERSESKDLVGCGKPIAFQREKRMSFRAVADGVASSPDGGILPIRVWLRLAPALE